MKESYDIVVIGAGASGLFAAVCAAKDGCRVCVLDHSGTPGKKLLATGNGRCNFTNHNQDPSAYRCGDPAFVTRALARFGTEQTLAFFKEELLIHAVCKNGCYYPRSNQARSVREALLAACKRNHVSIQNGITVTQIRPVAEHPGGSRILIRTDHKSLETGACILAAGGMAYPKTGSDGSGYTLAKQLGHRITKPLPALVPLICKGRYLSLTAGVRVHAKVRLVISCEKAGQTPTPFEVSDTGEVQMTAYGISGIPVFQVSRYASIALTRGEKVSAHLDFLPEYSKEESAVMIRTAMAADNPRVALCGLFPEQIAELLLKIAGDSPERMLSVCRDYTLPVTGTKGFEQAQVTTGGVRVCEVDPDTMESRICPGIYFAGEILDVDGACGGYNLQWAWTSGWIAACAASESGTRNRQSII